MFFEEWQHRPNAKIACSTWRRGGDERYRLARVKVALRISNAWRQTDQRPK
jgi:hypothetical protein